MEFIQSIYDAIMTLIVKVLAVFGISAENIPDFVPVPEIEESILGGHGGGDAGIIKDLYEYLCGTYTGCSVADISISVANHLIGFAAEEARHTDTVVALDSFFARNNYENKYF